MKSLVALSIAALASAVVASADVERIENFAWQVGDSPIVKLRTFKGSVVVEKGQANQVELEFKARTGEEADADWLDQIKISSYPFGAGLAIDVVRTSRGIEIGAKGSPWRDIQLVLKVPATVNLDLKSQFGSLDIVGDMTGHMRARTEAGNVYFGRVDGSVKAVSASGDVSLARATGEIELRSLRGQVTVGTVLERAKLRSVNGGIEVMSVQGEIEAVAVKGDIVAGIGHNVNGEVNFLAEIGDVKVRLDPTSAMSLEARTSWGRVSSELPLKINRGGDGKRRLEGDLNGGGPRIALRSQGGNVMIESESALAAF